MGKKSGKPVLITKASGEKVAFLPEKLRQSLQRSGADDIIIESVIEKLVPQLYDGISTRNIYRLAFSLLKKVSKPHAARYKLKQAIMEFGPSGFPFEKFVGEIFRAQGYTARVGVIAEGQCVKHEIDVIAEKGEHYLMIECKFHNLPGIKSDVKIPLYIQARFQDVEKQRLQQSENNASFHQGWVVTNTKFTDDAVQYGGCVGLHLLGWDYPRKGSLNKLIDAYGLHPLTSLTTLTKAEKQHLIEKGVVLCKEICESPHLLDSLHIAKTRTNNILKECQQLCRQIGKHDPAG
ncbi:MAG: restriction endonuclease [Cyclobacteriaceae bacterium]|nr:restriction endonuclease [Cyclobacteriaceae bacterium]